MDGREVGTLAMREKIEKFSSRWPNSYILAWQELLVGGADEDVDGKFDKSREEKGPDTK